MNLNWASPWEEEIAEVTTGSFQASVSIDNHDSLWGKVKRGEDWLPDAQSHWAPSGGQHERVSETSRRETPDDRRPLSLPLPSRLHSPDPWAGVSSFNDKIAEAHNIVLHPDGSAESQERKSTSHEQIGVGDIGQDLEFGLGNSGVFGASTLGEVQQKKEKGLEVDDLTEGVRSPQQGPASSRPPSSLSDHNDNLTESSRTSFEQETPQDLSKVKKLVSHFDRLTNNVGDTPVVARTISSNENKSSETIRPNDDSVGNNSEGDGFGDFEEETPVQISEIDNVESDIATVRCAVDFSVDISLVDKLLADIFHASGALQGSSATVDHRTHQDVFTTIEERKAWHRISRYGTMRKHNTGNDENYRHVKWGSSKIREETVRIVSRWRTEDSIGGSIVLGGGNKSSMFGWDDKDKRNSVPINMAAIWAERSERVSKQKTKPLSIIKTGPESSPGMVNQKPLCDSKSQSEALAKFGWSTEGIGANEKYNTPPSPAPSSSLSLSPPPPLSLSGFPTPLSQPLKAQKAQPLTRPSSLDYSHHPRIASIKGLGHRSTMSLDRKSPRPMSAPILPGVNPVLPASKSHNSPPLELPVPNKDVEDDWGDMVSSTLDKDAALTLPNSAQQESTGPRNQADLIPGLQDSEQASSTKRPLSLHAGDVHSLSLTDLAGSESHSSDSNDSALPNIDESKPVNLTAVSELSSTPSRSNFSGMAKLSSITDDFDVWGTTPLIAEARVDTLTEPVSGSQPSSNALDNFNAWASIDDLPTSASDTKLLAIAADTSVSPSQSSQAPPISTNVNDIMDGWADADLSVFESSITHAVTPLKNELPKYKANYSDGSLNETPNSAIPSRPNIDNISDAAEEERIAQSIVGKLPSLRYMFLK